MTGTNGHEPATGSLWYFLGAHWRYLGSAIDRDGKPGVRLQHRDQPKVTRTTDRRLFERKALEGSEKP